MSTPGRRKKGFALSLLTLVALFFGSLAQASDWIRLRETNTGTAYYDKENIRKVSGNRIAVSVKFVYTTEGVKEFREAFPDVNPSEKIGYTLYGYELDCSSAAFRNVKAVTYNASGIAIKGTKLEESEAGAEMEHITPKSIMEQLFTSICPGSR